MCLWALLFLQESVKNVIVNNPIKSNHYEKDAFHSFSIVPDSVECLCGSCI